MSDQNNQYDQPMAGHEYDGITEFDNPLPMWWLWTFFGTIIFAFIYYIHYEFNVGPTSDQELKTDMAAIEKLKTEGAKANSGPIDWPAIMNDPKRVETGAAVYIAKCAACHGDKGQGLVGPNLTDKAWLHGAKPDEVNTVIVKGVLDKGMPPWDGILKPEEIKDLVVFINSIKGTNPPGGKHPEGEDIPDYY